MVGTQVGRRSSHVIRRDPAAPWRHLDLVLVAATVMLAITGLVMIYSATKHRLALEGASTHYYLDKQLLFVAVGLVVMFAVAFFDYRIYREFSLVVYGGTLLLLLAVLSPLGASSKGAQSWFSVGTFQLQPSEFAKVPLIIALAAYAAIHRGDLDVRRVAVILALAIVPIGLTELQPDLGTALVFGAVLFAVLLVAGAKARHLVALVLLGAIGVFAVLQLGVLKQYQLDRLGAFLNPGGDTQRSTYNLDQSKIAIGSGGLTGKGLFKGPQTNLSYVPEQHTDFIFTVVGEELGLVGSALLLALFAVVMWRTWRAANLSKDLFGSLVCVGVLAMLLFQVFENAGMTMGIMPIAGIPLPFLSYGGSSTVVSFAGIGLVLNVHMRRFS